MENGRGLWSNWAGLGDVTSSMQVQRGLGAPRVAVPSIGGTINILTQTTDAEEGGNVITIFRERWLQKVRHNVFYRFNGEWICCNCFCIEKLMVMVMLEVPI